MMLRAATTALTVSLLTACSTMSTAPVYSQANLPAAVQVPVGNKVALETVGVGDITYQCKAKKDVAGQFEWVFMGPAAALNDRKGVQIGKYYGPPATWENKDGSKITGTQVAIAPSSAGNIPNQLVKASPASGEGVMVGISYIQRVNTVGGVAPSGICGASNTGAREVVEYQADYIFYKAEI